MSSEQPKLSEINISFSVGGKVQIIKFDISSDYHVSLSRKWEIPEDWTNEQAEAWQLEQLAKLRAVVDVVGQKEFDDRFSQSYLNEG